MPTKIDWADGCWNLVYGCLRECRYCYARGIAKRFANVIAAKEAKYRGWPNGSLDKKAMAKMLYGFSLVLLESNLLRKFPPREFRIFVNSMSDICYWKPEWMQAAYDRIVTERDRYFLYLTKNPSVYQDNFGFFNHPNILRGMTLTGNNGTDFSYDRGTSPLTFVQFVSIEPLLGGGTAKVLHLFPNLRWIILGAETGNRKGKVIPRTEWIRDIVAYANEKNIPIFMKKSLRTYCDGKDLKFVQQHCV